jgi:hypothetical protein
VDLLQGIALAAAGLGLLFFVAGISAARRRRLIRLATHWVLALLFGVTAALFIAISVGTQGYRALTHEETAATVEVRPVGRQRFEARFRFSDGRAQTFMLRGDELYIDAHILKWKPVVNLLGLHTDYELDRVSGRYAALEDERGQPRSVFSLGAERPIDLFEARRRHALLGLLVDAEYGSATFIGVDRPTRFALRVSTTGLLIREL